MKVFHDFLKMVVDITLKMMLRKKAKRVMKNYRHARYRFFLEFSPTQPLQIKRETTTLWWIDKVVVITNKVIFMATQNLEFLQPTPSYATRLRPFGAVVNIELPMHGYCVADDAARERLIEVGGVAGFMSVH